jgi:hypothetical protein
MTDDYVMPNVAVIAVHGVGAQEPLETARAIGDLLQDLDQRRPPLTDTPPPPAPPAAVSPSYDPFTERTIRINVRPVVVSDGGSQRASGIRGPFHDLVGETWKRRQQAGDRAAIDDDELSVAFMRGQLRNYRGDDPAETYQTARLEGRRRVPDGHDRVVHIYEAFWSDLSSVQGGVLRIFGELYQLLFHLPSLGTHAVDAETPHHSSSTWAWFRRMQSWSAIALTAPIPMLNLFMLGAAAIVPSFVFLDGLSPGRQLVISVAANGAAVVGVVGLLFWFVFRRKWALWLLPVVLWAAAVAFAAWRATDLTKAACEGTSSLAGCAAASTSLLLFEGVVIPIVVAFAVAWIVMAYNKRRPNVSKWAAALTALPVAGFLLARIDVTGASNDLVGAWIRAFEVMYLALVAAWIAFYIVGAAALIAGWIAVGARPATDPARRCRLTANVTLSVAAFSFSMVTLAVWGVIGLVLQKAIGDVSYSTYFELLRHGSTVGALIDAALTNSAVVLPILAIAGALSALPAMWGLTPVVLSEIAAPDQYRARRQRYATRLGEWLDLTFNGLLLSGVILYAAVMIVAPAVAYYAMRHLAPGAGKTAIQALGTLSGTAFAWLLVMRGRFKDLALGFRPLLDTMLDVDNWFREHPLDRNPKARICGRYASLLRYICNWTDPVHGGHYDAVIVVSHSQGTVITADLLRFLHHEASGRGGMGKYDPELRRLGEDPHRLPVTLFTMGSPLRALYGRRFPRLYAWAHHADGPQPRRPDPDLLGLVSWVNAYRSGDYVGRYLWRDSSNPDNWRVAAVTTNSPKSREFCIGAGAHTHYWDATAPAIARQLDELIAQAPAGAAV